MKREESIVSLPRVQCTPTEAQEKNMDYTANMKTVRFSEHNKAVANPVIFSRQEQEAMFSTVEDRNCALRATQIELESATRFSYDLIRGLENIVISHGELARRHRFMEGFLLLQDTLQRSECTPDEQQETLSEYVAAFTKGSQREALRLAKWDEKEARKVYKQGKSIHIQANKKVKETKRGSKFLKSLVPQRFRRQ
jgi:hypothetical protein